MNEWLVGGLLAFLVALAAFLGFGWLSAHRALKALCSVEEIEWLDVRRQLRAAIKYENKEPML